MSSVLITIIRLYTYTCKSKVLAWNSQCTRPCARHSHSSILVHVNDTPDRWSVDISPRLFASWPVTNNDRCYTNKNAQRKPATAWWRSV